MERFFVITGGPGSGKTTLIEALAASGVAVSPEVGRAVIRAEVEAGSTALPWADRDAFADRMLAAEVAAYRAATAGDGIVVFDRGVPDVLGYRRLSGLAIPASLPTAIDACPYNGTVFIAPPWREIFTQDTEQHQDFAEAEATYEVMRTVYTELGYALVPLPHAPVAARATFVRDRIAA